MFEKSRYLYVTLLSVWRKSHDVHEQQKQTNSPTPGIEPGPPGWKPGILAIRPRGIPCKENEFPHIIFYSIKHTNS